MLQLIGLTNFQLYLCSTFLKANFTSKLDFASNLSNITSEYYKFTNIFSKFKAKVFTPCYSHNFKLI